MTYETLKKIHPEDQNQLKVLPSYGHQDLFMGKNNYENVFSHLMDFLKKHQ